MKINETNYLQELRKGREEALNFVITKYGGLVQAIIRKHLYLMKDKQLHKIKKKQRIKNIGKKIAVAGFLAVFGVASLSIVSYASNGRVFPFLYTFFNGSRITYTQRDEMDITEIEMDATKNPPVKLKEGKLYLTVGEETIDITKQISVDEPYIWEWEDKQGNIHKFIIGGEPYEASYGYEENIFKKDGSFIGASSYYGSHIKGMEENKEPEWLIRGRKKIGR